MRIVACLVLHAFPGCGDQQCQPAANLTPWSIFLLPSLFFQTKRTQAIRTQLSAATSENQTLVGQLASLKQQLAAASAAAASTNTAASAAAEKALAEANKRAERLAAQVCVASMVTVCRGRGSPLQWLLHHLEGAVASLFADACT
jgi:septal ring factor EnvC (AmiA/AmiB activator)